MSAKVANFVEKRVAKARISATSLIFTVFGDTISVHGGSVWLTSLIETMSRFGINERLVRTSVYRLVGDGLLESTKVGRCSYYSFSENGRHHTDRADEKIYAASRDAIEHNWTLILLPGGTADDKKSELRTGLSWLGFRQLRPMLFANPSCDQKALEELLSESGAADLAIQFNAEPFNRNSQNLLRQEVFDRWELNEVTSHYEEFCKIYRPYIKQAASKSLSAEDCFLLRTMLVHEYRRIILRDPNLPQAMLPVNWAGFAAHEIAKTLYKDIAPAAEAWITNSMENAVSGLPAAQKKFYKRFGGLQKSAS